MRVTEIQNEWTRAQKALRVAQVLLPMGLPEDAISRAYLAVLHSAKAALLVLDVVVETHEAVHELFETSLVEPGYVENEWSEILGETQEQRQLADYEAALHLDPQLAAQAGSEAERFMERMHQHLLANSVDLASE